VSSRQWCFGRQAGFVVAVVAAGVVVSSMEAALAAPQGQTTHVSKSQSFHGHTGAASRMGGKEVSGEDLWKLATGDQPFRVEVHTGDGDVQVVTGAGGSTGGQVTIHSQDGQKETISISQYKIRLAEKHLKTGEVSMYDSSQYTVDNMIDRIKQKDTVNGKVLEALDLLPGRDVEPKEVANKIHGYNGDLSEDRATIGKSFSALADLGLIKKVKEGNAAEKQAPQYRALTPAEKNTADARSLQQRIRDIAKLQRPSAEIVKAIYGKPADGFDPNNFTAKDLTSQTDMKHPQVKTVVSGLADVGLIIEISPSSRGAFAGKRGSVIPASYGAWPGITLDQ